MDMVGTVFVLLAVGVIYVLGRVLLALFLE